MRERVELKYETLTKNVHFYLTYLFLETGDFRNAVKHGEIVLKYYEGRLVKKTQFTVMQYLAEAYCMLAQHEKAIQMLDDAQSLMNAGRSRAEEDTKLTVEMLTNKLIHGDKLASKTIIQMNKAAIMLCQGDLISAKNQLDEILEDQNLKVVHTDQSNSEIIPDYLINLLLYFLLVTSKYTITHQILSFSCFLNDLMNFRSLLSSRELQNGKTHDEVPQIRPRHEPRRFGQRHGAYLGLNQPTGIADRSDRVIRKPRPL